MSEFYVPEGWKLVPVEPTPAMIEAGNKAAHAGGSDLYQLKREVMNAYGAMLSAAPAAPVARAEQDPVATVVERKEGSRTWFDGVIHATAIVMEQIKDGDPLYAAPPAQPDASGLVEALESARLFIRNGIDLGFIRMPDGDTPDPAHETLPKIERALSVYRAALSGKGATK